LPSYHLSSNMRENRMNIADFYGFHADATSIEPYKNGNINGR